MIFFLVHIICKTHAAADIFFFSLIFGDCIYMIYVLLCVYCYLLLWLFLFFFSALFSFFGFVWIWLFLNRGSEIQAPVGPNRDLYATCQFSTLEEAIRVSVACWQGYDRPGPKGDKQE